MQLLPGHFSGSVFRGIFISCVRNGSGRFCVRFFARRMNGMIPEKIFHLLMVDGLHFEEGLRHRMEHFQIFREDIQRIFIGLIQIFVHFLVDDRRHGLAVVPFRAELLAQEDLFLMLAEYHRSPIP